MSYSEPPTSVEEFNEKCRGCIYECKAPSSADTELCPKYAPRDMTLTEEERISVEDAIRAEREKRDAIRAGKLARIFSKRNITAPDRRRALLDLQESRSRYLSRKRAVLRAAEMSRSRVSDMEVPANAKDGGR